jgi:hypothetical protein
LIADYRVVGRFRAREANGRTQGKRWPGPSAHSTLNRQFVCLVQFRAYLGSRSSHIGSHIVEFYNVLTAELALGRLFVWENSDEEMGPVGGLLC